MLIPIVYLGGYLGPRVKGDYYKNIFSQKKCPVIRGPKYLLSPADRELKKKMGKKKK